MRNKFGWYALGEGVATFKAKTDLTQGDKESTLAWLDELADYTYTYFQDIHTDDPGCTSGLTTNEPPTWLPRETQERREGGRHILINKGYLRKLESWRSLTVEQVQSLWLKLAETLLHELAHAAHFAMFDFFYVEHLFFEDEAVAEDGFAYTTTCSATVA
jgi:hypothetical protein